MRQILILWINAARPKTLCIGAAPILFGSLLALKRQQFDLTTFLLCLLGALSIQIGTNYCNDYYDFLYKADTLSRKGNQKVLSQGLLSPHAMKLAFIFAFFIAGLIAVFLIKRGGIVIVPIACMCIFFSIAYTAPPYPLAYLGLGDLFVLIFYGPVATLTCFYLHTRSFQWENLLIGFIPGILGLGPLIMNNLRDIHQDRIALKKTLIVRFGETFGKVYFLLTIFASLLATYLQSFFFDKNPYVFLTCIAYIPLCKQLPLLFSYQDKSELHHLFIASAKTVPLYIIMYGLSELVFYASKHLFI
jgi:1,4-dihydroxy-2-naphthoate octaprenyltransferase